jgi:hypothetical protein
LFLDIGNTKKGFLSPPPLPCHKVTEPGGFVLSKGFIFECKLDKMLSLLVMFTQESRLDKKNKKLPCSGRLHFILTVSNKDD